MKADASTRTIVAILVVVAAFVAFWMLLLSPKRKEADDLSVKVEGLQATLSQVQAEVTEGEEAKRDFASNYHQLVVLGKAVPAGDETSSLLVQLNHVASSADVSFEGIELGATSEAATTEAPVESVGEASSLSSAPAAATPTEAEASLLPLGATVGPAGLSVMPYDLTFTGSFFNVADFINGIDSLVGTAGSKVAVDGRLVTLDGFALKEQNGEFPTLHANFSVTTYLLPPGQGLTAGASTTGPAAAGAAVETGGEAETAEATETAEAEGAPSSETEGAQ